MIWLVVLGLGFWAFFQQLRITDLTERLAQLSRDFAALAEARKATAPVRVTPPERVTETPAVSPPVPTRAPAPELTASPPPRVAAPVADAAPVTTAPTPPPRPSPPPAPPGPSLSDWLSENGLAWIGGGALALGGLLLVAYAAQRGFFTPGMRIGAAVILGLGALGAGEALRRGLWAKAGPNQLVASLTTAAGAATLYAAIWAADLLYHFISPGEAGALLAAVSLGLLVLALLHGEALGILAVIAAYAVPVVTGGGGWGGATLNGFVLLILATGAAVAGLRRWGRVGVFTLAGAGLWGLARLTPDHVGAAMITAAAPLLALAAAVYAGRKPPSETAPAARLFDSLPGLAVTGASLMAALLWMVSRYGSALDPVLATGAILLAVVLGVRTQRIAPGLLWGPALALVVAAGVRSLEAYRSQDLPWLMLALAGLALASLDGALKSARPRIAAVAGGLGVALALTLAAPALARALPGVDGMVDAGFAGLFAIGAAILARRSADAAQDWTPAVFIGAAAETAGLALHASLDGRIAPTAYGLLALALTGLAVRIRWRGLAEAAAVAALASLGGLLAPAVTAEALVGSASALTIAAACGGAAVAQLTAWRVLKFRPDANASAEAISTSALVSALLGAFLVLQVWARPTGGPTRLDGFTEASLRTLLLLASGLMLAIRGAATPWGRARAPILLALGVLHGLALEGLALHPWWGWGEGRLVLGPPLADGLALGLLAPSLLLLEAARRPGVRGMRLSGPAVGAGLVFAVLWLVSEVRRLFHGPALDVGALGYAEAAAYAAAILGLAAALEAGRARLGALADSENGLGAVVGGSAWLALAAALWLLAFVASPWWGPLEGDLRAPALLGLLYIAGCGLSAGLAWRARTDGRPALARAALISAGIEVFALLTLIVRFAFHGAAMRAPLKEASFETWAFSAVWALYGLALLAAGASRRAQVLRGLGLCVLLGTTLKVFLFDLARLDGPIRAASFLGLGVVLLVGALAARRFGAAGRAKAET